MEQNIGGKTEIKNELWESSETLKNEKVKNSRRLYTKAKNFKIRERNI